MCSDVSLKVVGLSKCYQIYDQPRDRLLQMLFGSRKKFYREFWAVKDVDFELRRGETVGIIGFNGAGKSTLLQMICGTLNQTSGTILAKEKIAALLELGAGFNPEFTGRENVLMNYAILGISRSETDRKLDDIIAFSGIGDFIEQPVKHYSSGMFARLAFSAAIHSEPELLIVDEALSVGDMAFQEKSFTRMKQLREAGTSILFVSHSISAVRNFCDRALWLEKGAVRAFGDRLKICDEYESEVEDLIRRESVQAKQIANEASRGCSKSLEKIIRIDSVSIEKETYQMGSDISININLTFGMATPAYGIGIIIQDAKSNIVSIINTLRDDFVITERKNEWLLIIRDHHFGPGEYLVTVSIPDELAMFSYDRWENCARFKVQMERNSRGLAKVEGYVRCKHEWV